MSRILWAVAWTVLIIAYGMGIWFHVTGFDMGGIPWGGLYLGTALLCTPLLGIGHYKARQFSRMFSPKTNKEEA